MASRNLSPWQFSGMMRTEDVGNPPGSSGGQ